MGGEEFSIRSGILAVKCHESHSSSMWGGAAGRDPDFFADSVRIGRRLRLQGRAREPGLVTQLGSRSHGSVRRHLANVPGGHLELILERQP